MPQLNWNSATWDGRYDWANAGEEWSAEWGGSEAQWFGAIYPRIHRFLPAKRILEIAPGYGRWTRFLLGQCEQLVGVDLSQVCVDACNERFRNGPGSFVKNDGLSLSAAEGPFDFVFSFDSLVHAEIDVLESYIPQIIHRLAPRGVAVIHHSSLADSSAPTNPHMRASVSAAAVRLFIEKSGGTILHQELINWGCEWLTDAITGFCRRGDCDSSFESPVQNKAFRTEAANIRTAISPWCKIAR